MQNRKLRLLALAAVIGLGGCGGEETEPAPTPEAPTPTTTGGGGTGSTGAFDPNAPEYQGDHSIPGDAEAGAAVYRANCAACHAADGRGNGGVTGANLADDRSRLAKNNDTLLTSIRDGRPNATPPMPAHRDLLTEQEILDALSYVRATFGENAHEQEDEGDDEEEEEAEGEGDE